MKAYNKGEWSEVYAFFKLLADGELHGADENLNYLPDVFYPIIKILRQEGGKNLEFVRNTKIRVIDADSGETLLEVPIETFKEQSVRLLEILRTSKGRSFSAEETEKFLNSIKISSFKSSSANKYDITLVVHDSRLNQEPTLNFSIKSLLGSPSTLLNPGQATNFVYEVTDCLLSDSQIEEVNATSGKTKIMDRTKKLFDNGCNLKFIETDGKVFSNNLSMIDSNLPLILASLVELHYRTHVRSVKILTEELEKLDPINYYAKNNNLEFYTYKIESFLLAVALGMTPSTRWDGNYSATGGYIVVKPSGEVLCYHIYNRDAFKKYLLLNTNIERASTTRHGYARVYKEEGVLKIKLNLQIRFIQ